MCEDLKGYGLSSLSKEVLKINAWLTRHSFKNDTSNPNQWKPLLKSLEMKIYLCFTASVLHIAFNI